MHSASYTLRETFVNREHGSSYDTWVRMGGMELERKADLDILLDRSQPGIRVSQISGRNGNITYTAVLEPLEVRLVEFEPIE